MDQSWGVGRRAVVLFVGLAVGALTVFVPSMVRSDAAAESRLVPRECDTGPKLPSTECFWLEVPERRDLATSRMIRLWVAVIRPDGLDSSLPPVIDLTGGPGESASNAFVDPDVELAPSVDRVLVVIDQRGTGRSQPRLACPELDPGLRVTDPYLERLELTRARVATCRDRIAAEGVDIGGYNTQESAADVVALRELLGVDQFMLRGYSYGGRLAREIARQDPDGVTALLLDGSLTSRPRGLAPVIERADAAIDRLAAACAASPSCATNGDVRANLEAGEARLNADPYTTPDGSTVTGEVVRAGLVTAMTRTDLLAAIPPVLAQLANGNFQVLDLLVAELTSAPQTDLDSIASGTYMVVTCADDGPETAADLAIRQDPGPWAEEVLQEAAHCDIWNIERDARLTEPTGNLPVLAYTGEFDPWAPVEMADEIAAAYPDATTILVPGSGHGVSFINECTTGISLTFTATPNPEPDTACVTDLPPLFPPE